MKIRQLLPALMFSYFAASAVLFPFFTIFLSDFCSPHQIGILMAIMPASMILFQPLWGKLAHHWGTQRMLLVSLCISSISATGFLFAQSFLDFTIVMVIYSVSTVSILPLIDTIVMSFDNSRYGSIRLWGSAGYGIAVFLSGAFKTHLLGFWSFLIHIGFLLVTFTIVLKISLMHPKQQKQNDKQKLRDGFFCLKKPLFLLLLASSLIIGISMKAYDSFFPVGLSKLDASDLLLGSAWILVIIPEIALFYLLDKLVHKIHAFKLIIGGILLYAIRMALISFFQVLWVWIVSQPLSSFAFCFWYYGTITTIDKMFTKDELSIGHSIFWAVTYGLGGIIGSLASGFIVNAFGLSVLFGVTAAACFIASALFYVFLKQFSAAKPATNALQDE